MTYTTGDILLNKYRIERLLGNGAYAEVYLATHIETMGLRALKVLRKDIPGVSEREYIEAQSNFLQEAQLGEKFIHPNLVRVYDYGQESGNQITVLEYCSSGSLAGRLHPPQGTVGDLKLGQVIQIGIDVARGLSVLHGRDVIHRDVKPGNILFDEQGVAKVSDLGLAQTPEEDYMRAGQGSVAPDHPGTFAYMPPEQRPGHKMPVKASADVYALGCVLYEALTGRMYYHKKPQTKLLDIRADVPSWLDELLVRMLLDDPEARPWDGSEVQGLLEQGVQEEARQKRAAQERQDAEEKARQEAEQKARREAEERARLEAQVRQQEEKERLAAVHRAALEAEARRQLEAEQKARWELEKKEAVQRAQQDAERKAQREAETRRQQIPAQKHPVEYNRNHENSPLTDKRERDIFRSPVLWIGIVLAGVVIFGLAAIGLVNLLAPEPTSQAQANTSTIIKDTAVAVTDLPTRVVMNTAPPNPTATRTQRPTASPIPTVKAKLPPAQAALGDSWTSPVDGMELVYIPAGDFQMGCDPAHNGVHDCFSDELPLHTVTLDAYWIDKTEVSNAQYAMCVADGACDAPNDKSSYSQSAYYGNTSYDNYPVINVSWEDASKYCKWAGRKLPTEAQWEKAARGESVLAYPWGDDEPTCDLVNGYVGGAMCTGDTTAVGSYVDGASPYGVLDMAGNVWEWVQDWYDGDYYSNQTEFTNPTGPSNGTYKVVRGGSFYYNADLRAAGRYYGSPDGRGDILGFRCAAPPAP